MKQVLIILIPVILLGISLAGGFTGNPLSIGNQSSQIFQLTDSGDSARDVLQIRSLIPGTITQNPTSTPTPGSSTPTPTGTTCTPTTKVAVNLLLDTSGSMYYPVGFNVLSKERAMKNAVNIFFNNLQNNDLIGVAQFGIFTREVISFNTKEQNQPIFASRINALIAEGATPTRTGALVSQSMLAQARATFTNPDYNWVLIILTDGYPNPPATENPTNPPDIISQIKASGIRIITIGLDLNDPNAQPSGFTPNDARQLLCSISTTCSLPANPGDFHESPTASDLENIYNSIATSICR